MEEGALVHLPGGRGQDVATELLGGLRAGSSQAWAALYDQLAPGIHRFAVSCLSGDVEAAEDVVVEALTYAARDIARFDPGRSSLSAWVYGIARHRVLAELRWRRRRKSVPAWAQVSFEDLPEMSGGGDLGACTAARLDAQRKVQTAADLLSESELEMLSLSSIDGLSVREVGQAAGRSEQATQMLLHRARQKARRAAIEGTLLIGGIHRYGGARDFAGFGAHSHWFAGLDDERRGGEFGISPELSPVGDDIVYCTHGPGIWGWPPVVGQIWTSKRDGSKAVNLSEEARLTGINMYPRWSPDGTMIAFIHWGNPGGEAAARGEAWVMRADGSSARRAVPRESLPTVVVFWSLDGSRLFCQTDEPYWGAPPASVDLCGRHVQVVATPGSRADWSPDRSRLAVSHHLRGEMEGQFGVWRQLVVTEADGSHRRVLVEHFIADVQLEACGRTQESRADALCWAGPLGPTWSPTGDKIAFLAAMPFDPERAQYGRAVDAWIYDLITRRLTKVTNGPHWMHSLSWR